jgi:hypothetical protein
MWLLAPPRMGEQMNGKRIGLRDVRQLNIGQTLWDGTVIGFGVRRQKSNAISYILKYRTAESRQRWLTIGRHGAPWTPDTARDQAKSLLGDVAKGSDPAADKKVKRRATTVAELCDLYLNDASAGRLLTRRKTAKTASTVATDRGRIECHIKPLLGRMAVTACSGRKDGPEVFDEKTKIHNGKGWQGRCQPDCWAVGSNFYLRRPP